jgi:thiosulfate/3-mercaptopyruvate sulfurtransferase
MDKFDYLLKPTDIAESQSQYIFVDCRKPSEYEGVNVKDAVQLPIDHWLKENNEDNIARGEKMLSAEQFISLMTRLGISNNTKVIAYDDNLGRGSTRFWFIAKHYGHKSVFVLNGGWKNYLNSKQPTETFFKKDIRFNYYTPCISNDYIISIEELVKHYESYKIIDARTDNEWSGKDLHGNPRGGHLPNAKHINYELLVSSEISNTFIDNTHIAEIAHANGLNEDDNIVTYCQAGVRASFVAFALRCAGYRNVAVFDGSMYQWSRTSILSIEKP